MSKPRILIFVDYYLPGFKAGGPIASVSRMAKHLCHDYELFIFTRDRDLGDDESYANVAKNEWMESAYGKSYYASPDRLESGDLEKLISELKPDAIYLNSYFSVLSRRVLSLRRQGKIAKAKIVLAPRGEFSEGALALKKLKKQAYLSFAQTLGLTKGIVWHVSSEHEATDVQRSIGSRAKTIIEAPDLMDLSDAESLPVRQVKRAGEAHFSWISRISPKKNLLAAIKMLAGLKGEIEFSIYGPIEDEEYWSLCQKEIFALPANITVQHRGPIPPDRVPASLAKSHFFLFPTLGENFGHVIPEALSAGCPVLVSDQTPWLDLEEFHAGWVIPLANHGQWTETLQKCADLEDDSFAEMRAAALDYVRRLHGAQKIQGNSKVFATALSQ